MFRWAVLGSTYCVITVGVTFLPGLPRLPRAVILPAALIMAFCFLAAFTVTFKAGVRAAGAQMKYLMSSVPSRVRVLGLTVAVGLFLVMVLSELAVHQSGVAGSTGHSAARAGREQRYQLRATLSAAGWLTTLAGLMLAGARRREPGPAQAPTTFHNEPFRVTGRGVR